MLHEVAEPTRPPRRNSRVTRHPPKIKAKNLPSEDENMVIEKSEPPRNVNENVACEALDTTSEANNLKLVDSSPAPQKHHASSFAREKQWGRDYDGSVMLVKCPDLANTLGRTNICEDIRTRMVDWMFEVLSKLRGPQNFNQYTFFRAVLIMDLFFKHHKGKTLDNEIVHITGLTCMYLASKYEDIYPLSLTSFTAEAAGGAFTNAQVCEQEFKILMTLQFFLSFSSVLDIRDFYLSRLV